MDNQGVEITSVQLPAGSIVIKYANGATETLPNTHATYEMMHEKWIIPLPPFITDKYKIQMRDITLCCINHNEKCECAIKDFFTSPNEEQVMKFLKYMRSRHIILPEEKAKWT